MGALTGTRNDSRHTKATLHLFCRHPVAQERFLRLLKRTDFRIVASCEFRLPGSGGDESDTPPPGDLIVIDGSDAALTLEFVRKLHFEQSGMRLLVLLPKLDDAVAYPLLRLGVKGLLSYRLSPRELVRAASQVAAGAYWVPRDLLDHFIESVLPELSGCKSLESEVEISRREREVLDLLLDNLANKEIASKLFVTERTIKFHVSNLLSKFHVQRRADLIVLWMQRNTAFPWLVRDFGSTLSAHVN
jgi:DNA-binding NarL/FixJ family response regulator